METVANLLPSLSDLILLNARYEPYGEEIHEF